MKNEKQTSGWEQKVNDIEGLPGGLKVYIKGLMRAERLAVAKAMAEAVVPAPKKDGHPMLTDGEVDNYNRCQADVSRLAEEFIAKL